MSAEAIRKIKTGGHRPPLQPQLSYSLLAPTGAAG